MSFVYNSRKYLSICITTFLDSKQYNILQADQTIIIWREVVAKHLIDFAAYFSVDFGQFICEKAFP